MKNVKNVIVILVFLAAITLSSVGIAVLILTSFSPDVPEILTAVVLNLTFWAIIWYTWQTRNLYIETRRLRKWAAADNSILRKQSITNIRPYLRLQNIEGIDDKIRLVNEGKGVAVNLQLKYKKSKEREVRYAVTAMAAAPGSFTDIHRNGIGLGLENGTIEIKYKDIEDRKYLVIFKPNELFNDKFEIVEQKEDKS